ncbi:MAG: FixH family protein [Nitrospiraceae bacterium]
MKHHLRSLAVGCGMVSLSGCMCMMPMGNMDMGRKDDMGKHGMEESRMPHAMAGMADPKQGGDISLTFTTIPDTPRVGKNLLRLKLADAKSGTPIPNAEVVFRFTMMMPGMIVREEKATLIKEGIYEAKADLKMAGQWDIAVEITQPGQPVRREMFTVLVG